MDMSEVKSAGEH